jgi:CelD/BcsL family acetyltransferase involved in cellulose biosynthesis
MVAQTAGEGRVLGMNVATSRFPLIQHRDSTVGGFAVAVARIEVLPDMAAAESVWRSLQREGVTTPYQHFDFLAPWQQHVGRHEHTTPFIVIGFDAASRPLFLLPLGLRHMGPLRVAEFLGGTHANFNFGLWRPEVARNLSTADLRKILAAIRAKGHGVDLLRLLRQPSAWDGVPNPFAQLSHQCSVDECARLTLSGSGQEVLNSQLSSAMRGRLRTKERKLQKLPGYRYFRAGSLAEVEQLLAFFFSAKATHMAAQGLRNVFAAPGVEAFVNQTCRDALPGETPLIEIHALEGDGEILAFFGAITDGRRLSLMFNTYTLNEHAKHSPGLILLMQVVANCADRGLTSFDLGVGEAGYKTFFCKEPEPLFDSFLPLSAAGLAAALAQRVGFAAKRRIKTTPALWKIAQQARRWTRGTPP